MQLIQLFIPIYDSEGNRFADNWFSQIKEKLTKRFGGLTIYQRAPASGLWKQATPKTTADQIIIYEVMAESLDMTFWKSYKTSLEEQFKHQNLLSGRVN